MTKGTFKWLRLSWEKDFSSLLSLNWILKLHSEIAFILTRETLSLSLFALFHMSMGRSSFSKRRINRNVLNSQAWIIYDGARTYVDWKREESRQPWIDEWSILTRSRRVPASPPHATIISHIVDCVCQCMWPNHLTSLSLSSSHRTTWVTIIQFPPFPFVAGMRQT
jgi:hypothetical protein